MIRVPNPVSIMVHGDQLKVEEIIANSPIRFGRGGRARLAKEAINHQVPISGRIICTPRASNIVRLWVRS